MAREITYDLQNPGYTIYHRAALGGLAATLQVLDRDSRRPKGIDWRVDATNVVLRWGNDLTDQQATRLLLEASFRLTSDKLVDLPGQQIPADHEDVRLAIHNGLCLTFLQHPKMRPGEKEPRRIMLRTVDQEQGIPATYKAFNDFAHRRGQGTGLLDGKHARGSSPGSWPASATIAQSVIPGAMAGSSELETSPEDALLLLFLIVGSAVYLLRPRTFQEKAQACVVIPDVVNLYGFTRSLKRLVMHSDRLHSGSYFGRVVGGAEEAALRFLIDLEGTEVTEQRGVAGATVIAMGKVAWDKNQVNRSMHVRLRRTYDEIGVFRAAWTHLGEGRAIRTKSGEAFVVPDTHVPELVAANLGADRHWCAGFIDLVREQKDFRGFLYQSRSKGFAAMNQAISDSVDRVVIDAFHDAWRRTMGAFGERARREGVSFERLVEVEQERMRNAILRAKTSDAIANWFLRFCADATSGGPLGTFREHAPTLQRFLFDPRNAERTQNLLLFALVSYVGDVNASKTSAEPVTVSNT